MSVRKITLATLAIMALAAALLVPRTIHNAAAELRRAAIAPRPILTFVALTRLMERYVHLTYISLQT